MIHEKPNKRLRVRLPVRRLVFELEAKAQMQWRCLECNARFLGPTDRSPADGCAECGSRRVIDINVVPIVRELPGRAGQPCKVLNAAGYMVAMDKETRKVAAAVAWTRKRDAVGAEVILEVAGAEVKR